MLAILASRAEDAPTSADAVATSISCTTSAWHERSDISQHVGEHRGLGPQGRGAFGVACRR